MVQIMQLRLKQKILGEHTGVSPETYLKHRFNEVRSDFPFFYSPINPFYYANFKWSESPSKG